MLDILEKNHKKDVLIYKHIIEHLFDISAMEAFIREKGFFGNFIRWT